MGTFSSKTARKLPKRAETPWAGARTPTSNDPPLPNRFRASENKNESIENDSGDPQLLTNLSRLGPVRVHHNMYSHNQPANHMSHILKSRSQSEAEVSMSQPTRNRLMASSLTDLLNERKTATSHKDVQRLGNKYGMDVEKLESVSRYVNTPSIGEGTTVKQIGENGEEIVTMRAVWVEISHDRPNKTPSGH